MSPSSIPVAIVTGAASGIGFAVVDLLLGRGLQVVATDVRLEPLAALHERYPDTLRVTRLDVSDAEAFQTLVDETVSAHGRLDYLFNNAGVTLVGEVRDMDVAHWRRILDVNLMGVVHGVAAAYPLMVKQGFGHIVNTASGMGLSPSPLFTAYSTTKYGVIGLSLGLRAEAKALGVRVSVVCPGFIQTGMFDAATMIGASADELLGKVPFRIRTSADCAAAVWRGIERNRDIIMYPGYVRFFWWVYWLAPWLLSYFDQQKMVTFRRVRRPPAP